jgi:hypothetical protein
LRSTGSHLDRARFKSPAKLRVCAHALADDVKVPRTVNLKKRRVGGRK